MYCLYKVERKECLILFSRILHHLTCVGVILLLGNINPLFELFIQSECVLLKHCNKIALAQYGLFL